MACLYILNPGDMQDVQTFDAVPNISKHAGELYRMCGNVFSHYDRNTGRWYEYDAQAYNSSVPIKVLRAAGLHP